MIVFMNSYVTYFENHWIVLSILWVLLIILARKIEMHWLDIIIPGLAFLLWGIFELILHFIQ